MNENLRIPIVIIVLFLVFSSGFLQTTQAGSTEAKALYQSFLTDVLTVDLAKYSVEKSGYGESPAETVSYTLNSTQGALSTWGIIENGVVTACSIDSITKGGSIIYTTPLRKQQNRGSENFPT